jgi:hypothetical protein
MMRKHTTGGSLQSTKWQMALGDGIPYEHFTVKDNAMQRSAKL